MKREYTVKICVLGLLSGLSFVLMMLAFSTPLIPSFVEFDFSEFPALIAAFIFGPVEGVVVCLIKNIMHLIPSTTGGIGEIANFMIGASFVATAGVIYKKIPSFKGSIIACVCGSLMMAAVGYPVNYFITYPYYSKVFMPMDVIVQAYREILPSVDSLSEALLIFNTPFNIIKGLAVSGLNLLCYRKLAYLYKSFGKR